MTWHTGYIPVSNPFSKRGNLRRYPLQHTSDSRFGSEHETYLACNVRVNYGNFLVSNVLARHELCEYYAFTK